MKKQLLIFFFFCPLFSFANTCESLFSSLFVHGGKLTVLDGESAVLLGKGWGASVYLVDGPNGPFARKIYSTDIKKFQWPQKARSLEDLKILDMFRASGIEGLNVVKVIQTKQVTDPRFPHMKRLIVDLEYHRGTDLEKLWLDGHLDAESISKYNRLVEEVAVFLRSYGNDISISEYKTYKDLKLVPTGMYQIISTATTVKKFQGDIMFKPDNILLTENGFVLIDPY